MQNNLLDLMENQPLVSIICLTYNEEEFVRDAFDGFLSQVVDFPFEVLVFDDASQDTTQEIIEEYVGKYPDIFKATLYKENYYQKGLRFFGSYQGLKTAKGKYIAFCEGDDYWCDNHKLQKQVEFLESHPEFEVCAHETRIRNDYYKEENGILFSHTKVNIFIDRSKQNHYKFADTLTGNIFHISSLMFRNDKLLEFPEWIYEVSAQDMVFYMILAERGDIYLMRDVMSVYRHNQKSITSTQTEFFNQVAFNNASMDILEKMDEYWEGKYHKEISKVESRYYVNNMFCYLSKSMRDFEMAKIMAKKARMYDMKTFWKYLFVESWEKLKKHL